MRMHPTGFIIAAGLLTTLTFGLTTPARSMSAESGNHKANSRVRRQIVSQTEQALKLPIGIMQRYRWLNRDAGTNPAGHILPGHGP